MEQDEARAKNTEGGGPEERKRRKGTLVGVGCLPTKRRRTLSLLLEGGPQERSRPDVAALHGPVIAKTMKKGSLVQFGLVDREGGLRGAHFLANRDQRIACCLAHVDEVLRGELAANGCEMALRALMEHDLLRLLLVLPCKPSQSLLHRPSELVAQGPIAHVPLTLHLDQPYQVKQVIGDGRWRFAARHRSDPGYVSLNTLDIGEDLAKGLEGPIEILQGLEGSDHVSAGAVPGTHLHLR